MLQGVNAEEVIRLIKARIADPHSRPESRLALVVEGGAMRGVYTGGTLLGLHLLNGTRAFDAVYGTSSGAVNAAHFLSGAGHLKAATYYKALIDGRFFHPLRLHRVVDIDYFVDGVLRGSIPLELDRVIATNIPLKIAALNCTDGCGQILDLPRNLPEAWDVIRAGVAMPLVYNRTVTINDKQYADGGHAIPFPLDAAIADGCTDILVLRSRDPNAPIEVDHLIFRLLYGHFFARGRKNLIDVYKNCPKTLGRLTALAAGRLPVKEGVRIATMAPVNPQVKASTMKASLLRSACHQMAREALAIFDGDDTELNALIADGVV